MKTIDLVGWLKNWFYTKNETDNLLTGKLNINLGVANRNVVTDENGDVSLEEKSGNNGFGSFYINDQGHLIYDTEAT